MRRVKPSAKTQEIIIEHLKAGKTLSVCVSITSIFGRLFGTGIKCTLDDLVDLVERGIITTHQYHYAGLCYIELLLAEVPDAQ